MYASKRPAVIAPNQQIKPADARALAFSGDTLSKDLDSITAILSLVLWTAMFTMGRLIAFWYTD